MPTKSLMHLHFVCYIVRCVGFFVFGHCVDVQTKYLLVLAFNVAVRTEVKEVLLKEVFPLCCSRAANVRGVMWYKTSITGVDLSHHWRSRMLGNTTIEHTA